MSHQGYVHKILTGRKDFLKTLRQTDGCSGFLQREESEHDHFGAGHAGTAYSAGLGFAAARDHKRLVITLFPLLVMVLLVAAFLSKL